MRRTVATASILLWLSLVLPHTVLAQRDIEAYQTVGLSIGWGAVRPTGHDLSGPIADDDASLHLSATTDLRQNDWALVYLRLDADLAGVRQHLGVSTGLRVLPPRRGPVAPYGGAGGGLLLLQPVANYAEAFSRDFKVRGEAFAGAEWTAAPGLYPYVEVRLTTARYLAASRQPSCTSAPERCLQYSARNVVHLGYSGSVGLRIRII